MRYLKNLFFFILHDDQSVNIALEHRPAPRAIYGRVHAFNFKTGKIVVSVFDYGMYYPRSFDAHMLTA